MINDDAFTRHQRCWLFNLNCIFFNDIERDDHPVGWSLQRSDKKKVLYERLAWLFHYTDEVLINLLHTKHSSLFMDKWKKEKKKGRIANTIVYAGRKANLHVKPVREITFYLKNKVPQSNFFLHILYK